MKSCSPFTAGHHLHDTVLYRNYQAHFHIYNIFYQKPTVPSSSSHQGWGLSAGSTPKAFPTANSSRFRIWQHRTALAVLHPHNPPACRAKVLRTEPTTAGHPHAGLECTKLQFKYLCPANITLKSRYNPRAEHSQSAPTPPAAPYKNLCHHPEAQRVFIKYLL